MFELLGPIRVGPGIEAKINEFGFALSVNGIYAVDSNVAFLWGSFGAPGGTYRSFLLRSDNGGKSWQEVMMPGYGGGVMFLTFKENFGLAVSAWTIEAFGPLQIFGTTDFGENWQHLSSAGHTLGIPLGLRIEDERNWQITMLFETGFPDSRVAVLTTNDGGLLWKETRNKFFEDFDGKRQEAIEQYALIEVNQPGTQWGWGCSQDICLANGQDGSNWQVYLDNSDTWVVESRNNTNQEWEASAKLPRMYNYNKGEITPQN
jgi:hypothetical protein